eukprot:CAMPEP_0169151870 /NCGR_PEP_ID=MMETSP1015-20121227/51123_1 /TAXON_ID=342587 /ORGANISM="Karlodinium micrum, Strain CCMP2283" /LENGTH=49 /DNA_ID= /DNA_START= /DNA_END= /DNA_ORIENTATION=
MSPKAKPKGKAKATGTGHATDADQADLMREKFRELDVDGSGSLDFSELA